ncbi:MAG: hypothetical protein AB8G22_18335, partial [Saprospiraceae bacterium]
MAKKTNHLLNKTSSIQFYKKLIISSLVLIGTFVVNAFPRVAPPVNPPAFADACAMENDAFQVGEEVTYKLYYNLNFIWIPA